MSANPLSIAILGAGATGCYFGSLLSLAGFSVTLLGRPRIVEQVQHNAGVTLSDYSGWQQKVMPSQVIAEPGAEKFAVVFVMVKAQQLATIAADLERITRPDSTIYLMQNGLIADTLLATWLPQRRVLRGITQFNVVTQGNAHFHKSTQGDFILADSPAAQTILSQWHQQLPEQSTALQVTPNIQAIINGKLLLNLNNALNALADKPIKQELLDRRLRRVLAAAMEEWLAVCRAANHEVAQLAAVKPTLVIKILRLPTWLFRLVARSMLAIDASARSSMWDDIQQGRKTEIEFLNQAVCKRASTYQLAAPVNQRIAEFIQQLEQGHDIRAAFANWLKTFA
ncbi:MAG: 2-dehydropantoate 2-reductase [Gammaproteobacteria bacterium]|nr:2-dehydropantoate 2-reductase [Gammaproteobacteria bacterium]